MRHHISSGGDTRRKRSPIEVQPISQRGFGYNTDELLRDTSSASSSEPDFQQYRSSDHLQERRLREELAMKILSENYPVSMGSDMKTIKRQEVVSVKAPPATRVIMPLQ